MASKEDIKARILRAHKPQSKGTTGNANSWSKDFGNEDGPFPKTPEARARNQEEIEVLEAYRKYKAGKILAEGKAAPTGDRAERIAKLREKIARKNRIETIKARIVEARKGKAAPTKMTESAAGVRAKALKIKEKVAALRRNISKLREDDYGMDPAAGAVSPTDDGMPSAAPTQLPPEVAAQLQQIVTEVNALATSAGLAPASDPTQQGDAAAGIPAASPAPGAAPLPEAIKRKQAILKAIQERKAAAAAPKGGDKMIEETRARVAARRAALAKLRAASLQEGDGGESVGDSPEFFGKYLAPDAAYQGVGPTVGPSAKFGDTAKPLAGPGGKTPASIKPAKTWPTKPMPSSEANAKKFGEDGKPFGNEEEEEKMEEAWDQKHLSRVLERKELNFKQMVRSGLLG
jgi:hypothetical protein